MITKTATQIRDGLLKRIHVDQHVIRDNTNNHEDAPPVTVQARGGPYKGHEVVILDAAGVECARVIYRPHDPLSCGARLWIECTGEVHTVIREPVALDSV